MKRFRGEPEYEFFAVIAEDDFSSLVQPSLAEDHPDAELEGRSPDPVYHLMRSLDARKEAVHEDRTAPIPLAVAAYTIASATRVAAKGAAIVGIVIGLLSILVLHF